jgi:hypothetical protein
LPPFLTSTELSIRSFGIFRRLCAYTLIITSGIAAFHSILMSCGGVFQTSVLEAWLLFIITVVIELASRVRLPRTRSVFLFSISISACFIRVTLLLVDFGQRLPFLFDVVFHLALFRSLLCAASIDHFGDHLELFRLGRIPHRERHLIVLFLDAMLLHLLKRVCRWHVLMITQIIINSVSTTLPERAVHACYESWRRGWLVGALCKGQAVMKLGGRGNRIGLSGLCTVPRKTRIRLRSRWLRVMIVITIQIESHLRGFAHLSFENLRGAMLRTR